MSVNEPPSAISDRPEQDEPDLTEELALDPQRQLVLRHRVERAEVGLTRRTHERIEGADLPEHVAHGVG
jgi:hypothetical protein